MNCPGYVVAKGAIPSTSYSHNNKWASFDFHLWWCGAMKWHRGMNTAQSKASSFLLFSYPHLNLFKSSWEIFSQRLNYLSQSTKIGMLIPLWQRYQYEVFPPFTWWAGSIHWEISEGHPAKGLLWWQKPSAPPMRKWLIHTPHKRWVSQEWALCGGWLSETLLIKRYLCVVEHNRQER